MIVDHDSAGIEPVRRRDVADAHLTHDFGQPCLADEVDKFHTGQRRRIGRLDDDRAASGNRGNDLMDNQTFSNIVA